MSCEVRTMRVGKTYSPIFSENKPFGLVATCPGQRKNAANVAVTAPRDVARQSYCLKSRLVRSNARLETLNRSTANVRTTFVGRMMATFCTLRVIGYPRFFATDSLHPFRNGDQPREREVRSKGSRE